MTSHISTEIQGSTLVITLDRAQAKNALSLAMYQSLSLALHQLDADEQLSCAVIYGSEQCFTAGNDLKDFLSGGELKPGHATVDFLYQLTATEKPIIAAVAGPAIGIGTTMLLHCDLVVAGSNAVFQLPFAKLGLCPEAASSALLPQLVGHQKAFELLVLGERFDAELGLQIGLINRLVEPEQVLITALSLADKLAALPVRAVTASKQLMRRDIKITEAVIAAELSQFQQLMDSDEAKQIIAGFFKK